MTTCQNKMCISVLNNSNKKPTVYIGKVETLECSIINNTGGDITLNAGKSNPATLAIFLPAFYADADYQNMKITLKDWKLTAYQAGSQMLSLQYAGADPGTWQDQQSIAFLITNVKSSATSATTGQVQFNPSGMNGNNIPPSVLTTLSLAKEPKKGNADLPLEVTLNSNKIFTSHEQHPIKNNLLLNFKNIGTTKLYSGTKPRPGNALVTVSFIYGNTSGALAPDDDKSNPQIGSAWNIKGQPSISSGNDWSVENPKITGQAKSPVWQLAPSSTNQGIIGTGINANITFDFNTIISLLIPGHTQMTIQFSNFPYDNTRVYNDKTFILDIIKEEPTPGILKFSPIGSSILSYEPDKPKSNALAHMNWQVINVQYVQLSWLGWCGTEVLLDSRNKTNDDPCDTDNPYGQILINEENYAVDLAKSFPNDVIMTLEAFDSSGRSIGSDQITFQFEQVITLSKFWINILAGLNNKSQVTIEASPTQLIGKENIILKNGSVIDPSSSSQDGSTLTDLYDLKDLIDSATISSADVFDSWRVEFNNNPEHAFSFKDRGEITTQFPSTTFIASAVELYTSIGLNQNKGSNLQLVFTEGKSALEIHYIDIVTKNTYRLIKSQAFVISKDGFGITFSDDDFTMATNGKGYYKGLNYDLKISLVIDQGKFSYLLSGKASAKNAKFSSEIDVKFVA